ncbi:hypothetical protein, partial [Salmonella enterica]|uniref:hypothetical protein n=1 Tax=Salmonella enterica TaxID=28901 RepID=UPI00329A2F49
IEEAVRKRAGQYGRRATDTIAQPRVHGRTPPTVEAAPARQFKTLAVDPTVMERSCLLPAVSDPAAVRAYKILRTRVLRRLEA